MTDIIEKNEYPVGIPLIEEGDSVKGGVDGDSNKQAIALADRTNYLKNKLDNLKPETIGAEKTGVAEQLMSSHLTDTDPHPTYIKQSVAEATYLKLEGSNLPNGYVKLDANGKIPSSLLDMIQSSYVTVANQAARLALPASTNLTICVQVDEDRLYYLNGGLNPSVDANWFKGQSATVSGVSRVFNRTGDITAQNGDYNADQISQTSTREFVTPAQKLSWTGKQDKLVSGTTIKTFKGVSLLGDGDFNPTPDQLGCAAKTHTHPTTDIINLEKLIRDTIGVSLAPGGGTVISYDAGTGKTTIATGGGGSGGITLVAEDRLNSIAGQLHNITMGSVGTYNLIAYALKKEAGSTGQLSPVSNFIAANKPNFNTTDAVVFDNTAKLYHGEVKALVADNGLYSSSILTDGVVDITPIVTGNVVPAMTANNLPAGYVASAINTAGANFAAWLAFDGKQGVTTDGGDCWAGLWAGMSDANPIWLRIDLPSAVKLSGYSMANRSVSESPPKSWKFQGSNDGGTTWDTLHTVTAAPDWITGEIRKYDFVASNVYKSYRVAITATYYSNRNWVAIAEMKLFPEGGKFLLRKDNVYYEMVSNVLTPVAGGTTVDAAYIASHGMTGLTAQTFNKGTMQMVGGGLYSYTYKYLPGAQIILPKALISGKRWEAVTKATATVTETSGGQTRFAVTLDLVNYYVFTAGAWSNIGALTADSAGGTKLNTQGMTAAALAAITDVQWKLLFTGNVVADFAIAYGLKISNATSDEAIITSLVLTTNNIASWKTQTPAEVEMRWYSDGVTYKTVTAGDYKLIYQLP